MHTMLSPGYAPVYDPNAHYPIYPAAGYSPGTEEIIPRRVFVGGFGPLVTEGDMKKLFSQFGNIREVKMTRSGEGVTRGYGFVTLDTEEEAQRILQLSRDHPEKFELKGRRLNLGKAIRRVVGYPVEYAVATPDGAVNKSGFAYYPAVQQIPPGYYPHQPQQFPVQQMVYSAAPQPIVLYPCGVQAQEPQAVMHSVHRVSVASSPSPIYTPEVDVQGSFGHCAPPFNYCQQTEETFHTNNNYFSFPPPARITSLDNEGKPRKAVSTEKVMESYNMDFPSLSQTAAGGDVPTKWRTPSDQNHTTPVRMTPHTPKQGLSLKKDRTATARQLSFVESSAWSMIMRATMPSTDFRLSSV